MSRNVGKRTFGFVRPAKIQIRLRMRSLIRIFAGQFSDDDAALRANNEDSDQTAHMLRLNLVSVYAHMSEGTFSQVESQMMMMIMMMMMMNIVHVLIIMLLLTICLLNSNNPNRNTASMRNILNCILLSTPAPMQVILARIYALNIKQD